LERIGTEIDLMMHAKNPVLAFRLIDQLELGPIVFSTNESKRLSPEEVKCLLPKSIDCMERAFDIFQEASATEKYFADEMSHDDESAIQQKRILLYSAFLLPFVGAEEVQLSSRRKSRSVEKVDEVTKSVLVYKLKLRLKDAVRAHLLHWTAESFLVQAERIGAKGRAEIGLILRKSGEINWKLGIVLAMVLSPSEDGRKRLTDLVGYIEKEDLIGVWNLKPFLNGKDLMEVFGKLKRGPNCRKILDFEMEAMLNHPNKGKQEIEELLRAKYKQFL